MGLHSSAVRFELVALATLLLDHVGMGFPTIRTIRGYILLRRVHARMGYCRDIAGETHVFQRRWRGPAEWYGYRSYCDRFELPVHGEHFELAERNPSTVECEACRRVRDSDRWTNHDEVKTGVCQGHIVEYQTSGGKIHVARTICSEARFEDLVMNIEEFDGNLPEQKQFVCERCWSGYETRQWQERDQGGTIKVEVETHDGLEAFHADSISTTPVEGGKSGVTLTSEDGVTKTIGREAIRSITVTPTRRVHY